MGVMTEPPYGIEDLHALLIEIYESGDTSPSGQTLFTDTLSEYTSAIALATSQAICTMLGLDSDDVRLLDLTAEQYKKLEASDMLAEYMMGKDELDD
jgi:hypothetical protein